MQSSGTSHIFAIQIQQKQGEKVNEVFPKCYVIYDIVILSTWYIFLFLIAICISAEIIV